MTKWWLVAGMGLLLVTGGWASDTLSDTPGTWTGSLSGPVATGHCTVECEQATRGTNVRFHASGLAPRVAYTAWWVDEDGREMPLGMHKVEWHSDQRGWLDFQVRLPQCPIGDKVKIILRTQTNGRSEQVLSGTIDEM